MQDDFLRARHAKKKKGRTTEYRNGKVMVLTLIKKDEALKDLAEQLKEFFSALTIEHHAYTTP